MAVKSPWKALSQTGTVIVFPMLRSQLHNDGVPYKDEDGKPVRSLTDAKGVYKLEATVNGDYRLEIVLPRQ